MKRQDQDIAQIHYERGITYLQKGDYARAIDAFDKTLRIDPHYPQAYHNRAIAHAATGNLDRALR